MGMEARWRNRMTIRWHEEKRRSRQTEVGKTGVEDLKSKSDIGEPLSVSDEVKSGRRNERDKDKRGRTHDLEGLGRKDAGMRNRGEQLRADICRD